MESFISTTRQVRASLLDTIQQRQTISLFSLVALISSIFLGYLTLRGVYRLYLSPLHKFPGPKLAAISGLYEAYYDLVPKGGGQFTLEIKRLHQKYGPIVRINPEELHVDDPEFYEVIYSTSKPYDKLKRLENRFSIPGATFSTASHELHKIRRAAISPFFAKSKVREQTVHIQNLMDTISQRLTDEYSGKDRVLNIHDLWRCFAADNIMGLMFGSPLDLHLCPDFQAPFTGAITKVTSWSHVMRYLPFLGMVTESLPYSLSKRLFPSFEPIIAYREEISEQVAKILRSDRRDIKQQSGPIDNPTIFHEMLASGLPPHELTHKRLQHESESLIGAGLETTAWTLAVGTFYVMHNPEIYKRLRDELAEAMPNPDHILPWASLETLTYLNAIVKETFRVGLGVVERLVRINRTGVWTYGDWTIPAGTPVSMDQYHMHMDDRVFESPEVFRPERWLGNPRGPDGVKPLTNYLTIFGRGSRMCLGLNLAYSEIYIGFATLFRRHELELFETTPRDVEFYSENTILSPWPGTKGIRILVK